MTDNTTLPAGGGGDTIRTIDRSQNIPETQSSKTQVVALDVGGENGEVLLSPTNPLPVVEASAILEVLGQILTAIRNTNLILGNLAESSIDDFGED